MVTRVLWAMSMVLSVSFVLPAQASDITHEFNNPSFGGNPFNSAHLLGVANATSDYKRPEDPDESDADQFLRTLQSRLLSSLASQITELIFGNNAQESGIIRFGDQEISFVRGVDSVTLTITDFATGAVTQIIVPIFQPRPTGG